MVPNLSGVRVDNFKSYLGLNEVFPFHSRKNLVLGCNGSGKSNLLDAILFVLLGPEAYLRSKKKTNLINLNSSQYSSFCLSELLFRFLKIRSWPKQFSLISFFIGKKFSKTGKSTYFFNGKIIRFKVISKIFKKLGLEIKSNIFAIQQGNIEDLAFFQEKNIKKNRKNFGDLINKIFDGSNFIPLLKILAQVLKLVKTKNKRYETMSLRTKNSELSFFVDCIEQTLSFFKKSRKVLLIESTIRLFVNIFKQRMLIRKKKTEFLNLLGVLIDFLQLENLFHLKSGCLSFCSTKFKKTYLRLKTRIKFFENNPDISQVSRRQNYDLSFSSLKNLKISRLTEIIQGGSIYLDFNNLQKINLLEIQKDYVGLNPKRIINNNPQYYFGTSAEIYKKCIASVIFQYIFYYFLKFPETRKPAFGMLNKNLILHCRKSKKQKENSQKTFTMATNFNITETMHKMSSEKNLIHFFKENSSIISNNSLPYFSATIQAEKFFCKTKYSKIIQTLFYVFKNIQLKKGESDWLRGKQEIDYSILKDEKSPLKIGTGEILGHEEDLNPRLVTKIKKRKRKVALSSKDSLFGIYLIQISSFLKMFNNIKEPEIKKTGEAFYCDLHGQFKIFDYGIFWGNGCQKKSMKSKLTLFKSDKFQNKDIFTQNMLSCNLFKRSFTKLKKFPNFFSTYHGVFSFPYLSFTICKFLTSKYIFLESYPKYENCFTGNDVYRDSRTLKISRGMVFKKCLLAISCLFFSRIARKNSLVLLYNHKIKKLFLELGTLKNRMREDFCSQKIAHYLRSKNFRFKNKSILVRKKVNLLLSMIFFRKIISLENVIKILDLFFDGLQYLNQMISAWFGTAVKILNLIKTYLNSIRFITRKMCLKFSSFCSKNYRVFKLIKQDDKKKGIYFNFSFSRPEKMKGQIRSRNKLKIEKTGRFFSFYNSLVKNFIFTKPGDLNYKKYQRNIIHKIRKEENNLNGCVNLKSLRTIIYFYWTSYFDLLINILKMVHFQRSNDYCAQTMVFESIFLKNLPKTFGLSRLWIRSNDFVDPFLSGASLEILTFEKEKKNLMIMSGGERSLVSAALILTINRVKHQSLCVFDEIDAALDNLNLEKILRYFSLYSLFSQIIFISLRINFVGRSNQIIGVKKLIHGSKFIPIR